jgi:hypothetical protein
MAMDSLKNHVDNMFSKYKGNKKIDELKYEVLSNLEAKVDDLTGNGMERSQAINEAKQGMSSIDYLIDENRQVYVNRYKLEYTQIALLYSIIAWILTIPIRIVSRGIIWDLVLFISSIIIGIRYFKLRAKKDNGYFQYKSFINIRLAHKSGKIAWIIWLVYIVVASLYTTAIRFGSNIWFSRPVSITGPYQFAEIAIVYLIPFITIILPLLFNVAPKLILKYEVGEDNENKG